MPRRSWSRVVAVAFLFACASSARAEWTGDYAAALVRARAERKPLLVDVRKGPDPVQDTFVALSEAQEPIARAYRSFVLARVDAIATERSPEVAQFLAQNPPVPSFAVVDPGGTFVTSWIWFDNLSTHLNYVNMTRHEIPAILRAFDAREKGNAGAADVMLAELNLRLLQVFRARNLYEIARDEFLKASNETDATKAAIGQQLAIYMSGKTNEALAELRKFTVKGTPSDIAAAAYVAIAKAYLHKEQIGPASAAFHDALGTAKEGTREWRQARDALLKLGDRSVASTSHTDALISINVPARTTMTGTTDFSAAADPRITRVQWSLDGKFVRTTFRPFTATIDLGRTPRLHVIDAVGYNDQGTPLARTMTTVNDRLDQLRVHIVSPATETISGRVTIEAAAYVPPGHDLKSIEFSWNDQPVGSASEAPYRLVFDAPPTFGYLRALGTLDDGRTADDAHVFNASGFGETFDVHTIVVPATVTDRKGKRVAGLRTEDFRAVNGGTRMNVTVRDVPDEPATIGLVVDLSASMASLLLPVMDISSRSINTVLSGNDKMFLVTFGEQPRLAQSLTGNRTLLQSRLDDVNAFGGTALSDALAFSMQQFTGATGKRALILITDGNEGASEQRASACLEMAKESGVPMYIIVPEESGDTEEGLQFRKVLRQMANVTGGLMFYRPKHNDLDAVVHRIRDEVRGQYLLSFTAGHADQPDTWQPLKVTVIGKPATVRTITGYYVR